MLKVLNFCDNIFMKVITEKSFTMDFNEKLQNLRKQKELTQEELAKKLYVSRTAVSKWESGRGYPNIESLKLIAGFFEITVDELLSTDEILDLAQKENYLKQNNLRDLVFGLLDIAASLLLFLPLFAQNANGTINEIGLLGLNAISPYLKICYLSLVFATIITGIITLALQTCNNHFWLKIKTPLSIVLNILSVTLFTLCRQPYPALLLLIFFMIKIAIFIKKQ